MKEHTRNKTEEQIHRQGSNKDRSTEETSNEIIRGNAGHNRGSANIGGASGMDEKSSTISRRDKGTGLATKDGLTGSDYDGQLSE
jgi:hypothetical protein